MARTSCTPPTILEHLVESPKLTIRRVDLTTSQRLEASGVHPLLARLWAARGITQTKDVQLEWPAMLAPTTLTHAEHAAKLLADAIASNKKMLFVADYDCDGATACAVGLRALRAMGADVDYLVPNRFETGYGLSPAVIDLALLHHAGKPDLIITVDNGIASVEGVAEANAQGIGVIVTDHHLPGQTLPNALAIVNPNQVGCGFPSKNLAGVGVIFYLMLALRAELRARGVYTENGGPRLDALADLVALGTVADVVKLDPNNRLLVTRGLDRMRRGLMQPGIRALFAVSARNPQAASGFDLGFALGPRINAAGRLADMRLGIECLQTDDLAHATQCAQALDQINRERRDIEGGMREQALLLAQSMLDGFDEPPSALCLFDPDFHEGVVGIVAARIKDQWHRPTFVFAASQADGKGDELKGSGRSLPGFHLRDALDLISKRHPGVLLRFGGHAMAAGCTIHADHIDVFESALQQVAQEWLDEATLQRRLDTDGPLLPEYRRVELVEQLNSEVWGQGFAAPTFCEELEVVSQRLVAEKHLSLRLRHQGDMVDAIWFGRVQPLAARATLAYRVETDAWQGQTRVRFVIEAAQE